MSKFIQYVGTPQQINKVIKDLVSSDTKLIDLTGDKELENSFSLYISLNPLEENIKSQLETMKNDKAKKIIINDCHVLNSSDIEPLIDLYKENDVDIFLFSNFEPLDLKIPFVRGISISEPLPYYDYSLNLVVDKRLEGNFGKFFNSEIPDIDFLEVLKASTKEKPFVVIFPEDMLSEPSNKFLMIANNTIKRALQDDDCDSVHVVFLKQK